MFKNEQFLRAQAQQSAACNARHIIPRRLATWLLRAQDITGSRDLTITQESVAHMLGVQRASVSQFASGLQEAGLIQYRRGRITIVDKSGLERMACGCYRAFRDTQLEMVGETPEFGCAEV